MGNKGSIPKPVNSRLGTSSAIKPPNNRTSNMNSSRTVSTKYSQNRVSNNMKDMLQEAVVADDNAKTVSDNISEIERKKDGQYTSDVNSCSQRTLGLDSDITTIKKKELSDLREELDKLKDDYKRVNLELKTNEDAKQTLIKEHQDEIERVRKEASSDAQAT